MYVCLCNGVTERDIRQAAAGGCRGMTELTMRTGCGASCGSCVSMACQLLDEEAQREACRISHDNGVGFPVSSAA